MGAPTEIELADAYCSYLARRHYENFLVTSWLAPAGARVHLRRIYAFCRITDDLGDESGDLATERLALWREDLERCFGGRRPPLHPVLLALADTIATYRLPREPFFDLIAANLQDQTVKQYDSWEQLRAYCLRSAAPVGRLVLRIFGVASPDLDALADDVCIGLQLANFAQDVSVDRQKGRTYLLQPELQELGVAGAVRAMCERAAQLLAAGRTLEARVQGPAARQLALYRLGGEAILRAVAARGYRTDLHRPQVPLSVKLALLLRVALESARRSHGAADHRTAQARHTSYP